MKLTGKSFSSKFCSYKLHGFIWQGHWEFLLPHPKPIWFKSKRGVQAAWTWSEMFYWMTLPISKPDYRPPFIRWKCKLFLCVGLFFLRIFECIKKSLGTNHCNLIIMASIRTLLQFDKKIKNEDKKNTWFPQCPFDKVTFCVAQTILVLLLKSVLGLQFITISIRHDLGLADLPVSSKFSSSSIWSIILVLIIPVFYIS